MPATKNRNYEKFKGARWLFSEVARKRKAWEQETGKKALRLDIGDTTLPIPPTIAAAMHLAVGNLAHQDTYTRYGDEQGDTRLRNAISDHYLNKSNVQVSPDEIFVSDGAKPDVGNIQTLFSLENIVALQDPAYPAYENTNVAAGRTGAPRAEGGFEGLVYMPCTTANEFIPEVPSQPVDLIYLCFPNNPTGAVATREQLRKFVDFARKDKSVIIFDAAYSSFISDPDLPASIYEVNGAKEVAIELGSFSKIAGFTGVRLGWAVVPKELQCSDSKPVELNQMWNRRQTTFFNGASNIAQEGGLAALTEQGQEECQELADYYMENAGIIRGALGRKTLRYHGGIHAPYIWAETPGKMDSWNFFDKLLGETGVSCTPGVGFGPSGQGYFRLTAFGSRENVERAAKSIEGNLQI